MSLDSDMHNYGPGKVIAGQYLLESVIAETTLATFFRARDQMTLEANGSESPLILASISDQFTGYPAFESTLQRVLEEFDRPGSPLDIAGAYRDGDSYWLIYNERGGEVISDILAGQDGQSLPVNRVQSILFNIFRAAKNFMSRGGYGFLEPGAILCTGNSCKLLNAPLAVVFRVLTSVSSSSKGEWVFGSPYVSPEVAQGMLPSSQDDTFSLATIAYQLLSNKLPYGETGIADSFAKRQSPIPLTQLGIHGWKTMRQGLSLQRGKRQISPYALLQGVAGHMEGMDDLADESSSRKAGRSSVLGKAAVMAGLGILISYVSYYVYQGTGISVDTVTAQNESHDVPVEVVTAATEETLEVMTDDKSLSGTVIAQDEVSSLPDTGLLEPVAAWVGISEELSPIVSSDTVISKTVLPESVASDIFDLALAEKENAVSDEQEESERIIEAAILAEVKAAKKVSVESEPATSAKTVQKVASKAVIPEKKGKEPETKVEKTVASKKPAVTAPTRSLQKEVETVAHSSRKKTMYASTLPTVAPAPMRLAPVRAIVPTKPVQPKPITPPRRVVQVSPNSFVVAAPTRLQKTVRQVGANTFVVASD